MSMDIEVPEDFTVVGENIHASRVVLRNGLRAITLDDGTEAVPFNNISGGECLLHVPEKYKQTQPYQQGQIKHFMIAMQKGISDDPKENHEGAEYIRSEVARQITSGAHFIDLNVDEISYELEIQKRAMKWVVEICQEVSSVPLSIDSSSTEIIEAGLEIYDGRAGQAIVNSVALDRMSALDLVTKYKTKAIVTGAGVDSMPQDAEERISNVKEILDVVQNSGLSLSDVHVDCIVFPISVAPDYGNHYLDAVKEIRGIYGSELHITGGLSNVSFGLPKRKLINDTFIYLSLQAGVNSGIIDPVQSNMKKIYDLDISSESVKFASNMLLGKDEFCVEYIQAWRDKRL